MVLVAVVNILDVLGAQEFPFGIVQGNAVDCHVLPGLPCGPCVLLLYHVPIHRNAPRLDGNRVSLHDVLLLAHVAPV